MLRGSTVKHLSTTLEDRVLITEGGVELAVALDRCTRTGSRGDAAAVTVASCTVECVVDLIGKLPSGRAGDGGGLSDRLSSRVGASLRTKRTTCERCSTSKASVTRTRADLTRLVAETRAVGQTLTSSKTRSSAQASTSTSTSKTLVAVTGTSAIVLGRAEARATASACGGRSVTLGTAMGLAGDLGQLRQAGGLTRRSDGEDRALPLVALGSQLLVFGGLGRDTTGQGDVLEYGVVLSNGNVDLGVLGPLLELFLLLLALHDAVLSRGGVALVHVLEVLRVRVALGLSLGAVSLSLDVVQHAIELVDGVLDLLLKHLLNGRAHNLEQERLEHVEEQLVVALLELDGQVLDVSLDLVDLEEVGLSVLASLVGGLKFNLEAETRASHKDVHHTLVGDGRESLLLLDVV